MNTCDDFMLELLFTVTNSRIYTYNTTLHNRLGLKIKIRGINKSDRIRYTEHLQLCYLIFALSNPLKAKQDLSIKFTSNDVLSTLNNIMSVGWFV